jgi:hypothetical protein
MITRLAFDYDYEPNLSDADSYNLFIADPDGTAHQEWSDAKASGVQFLAYLSWFEIGPTDPYLASGHKLLKEAKNRGIKVLAENPRWKSKIMDVANPDWQELFAELVADAVGKGYAGIYFDTWDGYGDVQRISDQKKAELMAANVAIVQRIRNEYPNLILMLNRGWKVMAPCAPFANRLLVESVWHSQDGPIDDAETADLTAKIARAKALKFEVNVLDYIPSGDVALAESICAKAKAIGCGCTVLRGALTHPEVLAVAS